MGKGRNQSAHKNNEQGNNKPSSRVLNLLRYVLYIPCIFSGQWAFTSSQTSCKWCCLNVFSWIAMIFSIIINLASIVFDLVVVIHCPYENCGFINVPSSTNDTSSDLSLTPDSPGQYSNLQKLVFTSASLSGTMSFACIIYALLKTYNYPLKFKKKYKKLPNVVILNPFCDEELNENKEPTESTILSGYQGVYFYAIFFPTSLSSLPVFLSFLLCTPTSIIMMLTGLTCFGTLVVFLANFIHGHVQF